MTKPKFVEWDLWDNKVMVRDGAAERARLRLYCLYLTLIMVIETYYRGHTDTSQRKFARDGLADSMALFGKSFTI